MGTWSWVIGGLLVAVGGILYTLELPTRVDDGIVDLSSTEVIMITKCSHVFYYISDLSNYAKWFPGIENVTALVPGPVENGKQYEETVSFPVYGDFVRLTYVTSYAPPKEFQFMYEDTSMVAVTMKLSQESPDRCLLRYNAGTRRTSLLFHVSMGLPLRLMYSLRGRHGMFAIRSMFNHAS
ncbi:uncharacterized protein [Watersipora subatra]|uniref:uncharacterized protein n=1 Tax=Watersipora subatra TaxID=2589382 RepID=UPI00355C3882